jgi:rRNA-processing protein FCF1
MTAEPRHGRKKPKIIFDSNAFFVPLQLKIDVFEELKLLLNTNFEPILLSPVRRELERLVEKESRKDKRAAYALRLAEKCKYVEVEENSESPDDIIAKVAKEWNSIVFTNDKQLRKRLRDINTPVIYVRQKARLEIDGRTPSLV